MASYIRSLSSKSTHLKRQCQARATYALHHRTVSESENESPRRVIYWSPTGCFLAQSGNNYSSRKLGNYSFATSPYSSRRYMSTEIGNVEGSSGLYDDVEIPSDFPVVADNVAAGEVAIAAADSFYPVALLQHVIDAVHIHSGLSWWASIAVTTIIIRTATLPLLIKQLKLTSKLTLLRPRLDGIRREMDEKGMDPTAITEGQKKMMGLFKEYGVSPLTPFIGAFIQAPIFISFFCAIRNMVEKVPSFKTGGAFWFVDLTTPDNLYVLPVLTALSILITVECNMQEGLEGNAIAGTMKKFFRVFAFATAPLTIGFPKALFCYWITSNFFSLTYGLVLKVPGVKKALGVPEIPAP